jgi:hypothetical protein
VVARLERLVRRAARFVAVAALVVGPGMVGASGASAATAIGSPQGDEGCGGVGTGMISALQASSTGPSYVVPAAGTLTAWSTTPGARGDSSAVFEVWRPAGDSGQFTLVYVSSATTISPGDSVETFALSPAVWVEAGDVLGIGVLGRNGEFCVEHTQNAGDVALALLTDALPQVGHTYGPADCSDVDVCLEKDAFISTTNYVTDIGAEFEPASNEASISTGGGLVTITTPQGTGLSDVTASAVPSSPPLPAGVQLTDGLIGFTIHGVIPGGTVHAVLTLPSAVDEYWKLQDGAWFRVTDASFDGDTVTLTLTDGGAGDADGVANGVIVDPGGPAVATDAPSTAGGSTAAGSGTTAGLGRAGARDATGLPRRPTTAPAPVLALPKFTG